MPYKFVVKKIKRFFIYRVLHVDDTPHRIALGLAIGIFITWTPTIGLQMVLTVLLAALMRANKLVGVPFVWISNPITALPLYGFNFLVGRWVLPGSYPWKLFQDSVANAVRFNGGWIDRIIAWWQATWFVFAPLWVGSILMGLILATVSYFVTRCAVVTYRKHWPHKHPPLETPDKASQGPPQEHQTDLRTEAAHAPFAAQSPPGPEDHRPAECLKSASHEDP